MTASEAPELGAADLQRELRAIHRQEHRTRVTALYGRGVACSVDVPVGEVALTFQVRPVRCELELREVLEERGAGEEGLALLVDYTMNLPEDVRVRMAGRRLYFVDESGRLASKFQARDASAEVVRCRALCRALLEEEPFTESPTPLLTQDHAWRCLLERRARFPLEQALSLDRLLEFAALQHPGEFARYLKGREKLQEELLGYVERTAGPLGAVVLRAWLRGLGLTVAAVTFLLEGAAELEGQPYLRASLAHQLRDIEPELDRLLQDQPERRRRWVEAAWPLYQLLLHGQEQERGRRALDLVLGEAERLVPDRDQEAVAGLCASDFLRQSYRLRQQRLAAALRAFTARPAAAGYEEARRQLGSLKKHQQARQEGQGGLLAQADMALRLCGYRLRRRDYAAQARHGADYDEMVLLAEHYAQEGGYVDLARHRARGRLHSQDPLEDAIAQVVAAADAQRDQDDERFARGLVPWLAARQPRAGVVSIDQALERLAVPFLTKGAHRRLLLLVMDGLSWASAVELLMALEEQEGIGPIRYQAPGLRPLTPVLAALPTTTAVSRAALFAGRPPRPGDPERTDLDPHRLLDHPSLHTAAGEAPKLLLRGELETPSGTIRQDALSEVRSTRRVVAVVVNAVDDQLHGSRQLQVRYGADTIKMLPDLLQAAAEANRAILLLSDHGHVPSSRLASVGRRAVQGKLRWRALGAQEAPCEGEIALEGDRTWRPRGVERLALLYRETESYGPVITVGEHGGASLAEVVAPALFLAHAELAQQVQREAQKEDPELEVHALAQPEWWSVEGFRAELPLVVETPAPAPPPAAAPQLSLSLAAPVPAAPRVVVAPPPPAAPSEWALLLRRYYASERGERLRKLESVIRWVDALAEHEGRMGVELFARVADVPVGRVGGLVTLMAEFLNVEEDPAVEFDRKSKQVVLHTALLKSYMGEV